MNPLLSSFQVEVRRPRDSVRHAVWSRQRVEHRADDLPHARLRGARSPADLPRAHAGRHHTLPCPLHARELLIQSFN